MEQTSTGLIVVGPEDGAGAPTLFLLLSEPGPVSKKDAGWFPNNLHIGKFGETKGLLVIHELVVFDASSPGSLCPGLHRIGNGHPRFVDPLSEKIGELNLAFKRPNVLARHVLVSYRDSDVVLILAFLVPFAHDGQIDGFPKFR